MNRRFWLGLTMVLALSAGMPVGAAAESPPRASSEAKTEQAFMYVLVINDVGGRRVVTTADNSQVRVLNGNGDRALMKVPVNTSLTPGYDLAILKTRGYDLPISGLLRLPYPRPGAFYAVKLSAFDTLIF